MKKKIRWPIRGKYFKLASFMSPQPSRRLTVFSHLSSPQNLPHQQIEKKYFDDNESSKSVEAIDIYLKEITRFPLLTAEEERQYAFKAQNGDLVARDKMIQSNLRLVVKMSRRYMKCGISFLDLIEEGNLGLMHALEKFDPDKGCRFSTYAAWWIQQNIERAIMNQSKTVRIPIHVSKLQNSIARTARSLSMDPTSPDLKRIALKLDKTEQELERAMIYQESNISIDAPVSNEIESSFINILKEDSFEDPFENLVNQSYKKKLDDLIEDLPEQNFDVIARRYGLFGFEPMTLQETGEDLGMTRERVRQIQVQSINILSKKDIDDLYGML
jgi:RNA polymerase nonessential primary-like sigma factor